MKCLKHLSSFEIMKIVDEMRVLEGFRLDKAFYSNDKLFLRFNCKPKKSVCVMIPNLVFLTDSVVLGNNHLSQTIRRMFNNRKLENLKQVGFDRIVEFEFNNGKVIVELFDKGNIVVCDAENNIVDFLRSKNLNRTFKHKKEYVYPKKLNPYELDAESLRKLLNKEIVKFLASDLSFGGVYAEWICHCAGVDKNKREIDLNESSRIIECFNTLKNMEVNAYVVFDDLRKGKPCDVFPVRLETLKGVYNKSKHFKSFSEAISYFINVLEPEEKKNPEEEKILKAINIQKQRLKSLEEEVLKYHDVGETIYKNYNLITKVLEEVQKVLNKKKDNKEKNELIREVLNRMKVNVLEVNLKEKTITIDL